MDNTKERSWGIFIDNMVKEIWKLSSPNSWNFVPGHLNPADLPSHGCSMSLLVKSEWWLGPSWLLQSEENWTKCNVSPTMNTVNSEKRKINVAAMNLENNKAKNNYLVDEQERLINYDKKYILCYYPALTM